MADVLRVHLEEGVLADGRTFTDFPSDVGCTVSDAGLLFHHEEPPHRPYAWFRRDLVRYVERIAAGGGVQIVPPWNSDAGRL